MITREKADFGVALMATLIVAFSLTSQAILFLENIWWVLFLKFLKREKGASIVHDPRVIWNTIDAVKNVMVTRLLPRQDMHF